MSKRMTGFFSFCRCSPSPPSARCPTPPSCSTTTLTTRTGRQSVRVVHVDTDVLYYHFDDTDRQGTALRGGCGAHPPLPSHALPRNPPQPLLSSPQTPAKLARAPASTPMHPICTGTRQNGVTGAGHVRRHTAEWRRRRRFARARPQVQPGAAQQQGAPRQQRRLAGRRLLPAGPLAGPHPLLAEQFAHDVRAFRAT